MTYNDRFDLKLGEPTKKLILFISLQSYFCFYLINSQMNFFLYGL
jgi:hypothetical protein